jgi:putative DNA primase/helicase
MRTETLTTREDFIRTGTGFFSKIFEQALKDKLGMINIRTFPAGALPTNNFFESETDAAVFAYDLFVQKRDVYFGVNPRTGLGGKKENVHYVTVFHLEVDYGTLGHKKKTDAATYDEALEMINNFPIKPSLVIHSGGGFHCYWILKEPIKVADFGIDHLENVNRALSLALGGDTGTHDLSRVLRIPGSCNFKQADNPRLVELVADNDVKYELHDFDEIVAANIDLINKPTVRAEKQAVSSISTQAIPASTDTNTIDINQLPVSDKIKNLIKLGNDGTYPSRSEADMAVVTALVNKGLIEAQIKQIFMTQIIGEKYRTHNAPEKYLKHTIDEAKKMSDMTEEEMMDPLFLSGSISRTDKKYTLHILNFQEYIVGKYKMKILDLERAIFLYNGRCYEQCSDKALNKLCQDELGNHRNLFTKSALSDLIHFATGDVLINSDKAQIDQLKFLTLQNGLYDLDTGILIPHTPDKFTTNLLPYIYDPSATCPRFIQFLDEIFMGDKMKIHFVQEAVGYIFHKSLPTPAVFFLIGNGSNGKSVFINTISNLVGKENTSNVSFNLLSDEVYILELYQKMVNISGETPNNKNMSTDVMKAVTAGDWVTGKELYKQPMKFRPFAKSFLAMNELPSITDKTHGMWRRIWVLNFPREFKPEEMDRNLESKLSQELSGIFNWALEGYNRLKGNDFALKESESMKLAKKDYRSNTDSARAFIQDKLKHSDNPNDRIQFSDLFKKYLVYCQVEGKKDIESKSTFRKILEDMKFKVSNSSKDGNQLFVFNVKIISE